MSETAFIVRPRLGEWYLTSDPITTYAQTSDRDEATRYPTRDAAVAAVADYFRGEHNRTPFVYQWCIESVGGFKWSKVTADKCGFRLELPVTKRPCNGLNVEWFGGSSRCFCKPDAMFRGNTELARRWVLSGGSPHVFGDCNSRCPRVPQGATS